MPLKPTYLIPINFHRSLAKIELLVNFDRKMISTQIFHQVFIIESGNYRCQHFD